ncbi:T9SS type B sorting domain-containing protein [Olleya sp. AH-315-F22]|nr:T9SS type B sorting domain-containing protein [Olleya sp. AH-315-F22]
MKIITKPLLWILLFTFCEGYSQIITINDAADTESVFSLQELIENVLISGTCSQISNFSEQVSGLPNEPQTKSYGFFKKPTGSNFPFDEGIVLTTGRAFPAGNTVNVTIPFPSFDNGLVGDTDLETALGITNTFDATFIKFNFVPTSNDISFRFLMASEEYNGSDECSFADGFAFLLREVGATTYTNLAVLPDLTPVNVTNINNAAGCASNVPFFEGYNLGDTNYGGRTVVLTAFANVIPNIAYEIKLVVADQRDPIFDSAIFLEAGSFNLGLDLGDDLAIVNGNPGCNGTEVLLDADIGLPLATYKWFKDSIELIGETNATLQVIADGTYSVEVEVSTGCVYTDEVFIEFTIPPIITLPPENIFMCESDNDLIEVFDFTTNEALVLGAQLATDFPVSYHATQIDAETNQNPLTIPYSNTLQYETIWIRIADITQTCFEVISFDIEVQKEPIAPSVINFEICDNNNDAYDTNGIVTFDLSTKINEVLGTQLIADFEVKFYYTLTDADAGITGTEIITPIQNTTNPQTIFARIENRLNTACFDTTTFNLVVNPLPIVTPLAELRQCDTDADGFTLFNLTEANTLISTNSANESFTYYLFEAQAQTGLVADQILNFLNYPNPIALNSSVYVRIEDNNGCYRTSRLDLIVGATQIPTTFNLMYEVCDNKLVDGDNTNGITSFDFSDATAQVEALFPMGQSLTITYYTNEADALAETNAIVDISNHRNDTSPTIQNIYVRVDSDDVNACLGLGNHITLTVNPLPDLNVIANYILCSDNTEAVFDLFTKNSEVIGLQTDPILISYHLSETDALNNIPIATASAYTNISNPQTIFVRAQFDINGNGQVDSEDCISTDMTFELVVIPNPIIFTPDEIRICSDQVNTIYDLTIRESQITGGDTTITLIYFETLLDLDNNIPIPDPTLYTSNVLNNTIFVLATGTNLCTSITTLTLTTILYANLNLMPSVIEECEIDNNGFDFFDITRRETEILNGLSVTDFTFTYYENEMDAIDGNSNNIINIFNFENTQIVTQTIYVRVQPIDNECFIVIPLILVVNPVPEIDIEDQYVICLDSNNIVINPVTITFLQNPPIDTQLNVNDYTFQWYNGTESEVNLDPNSFIILGETASTYSPTVVGNYTVFATNNVTGCTIPASTIVVGSYPPESISLEMISNAFSSNNIIQVTVIGNGEYEFKLDDGSWQNSNIFENVTGGEHTIFVRDLFNCNELSEVQIVIDYPRFFTPNNDGYFDTWNIFGITNQPNSKIYIFDRYGKLVNQLSPTNIGWDGTYNGRKMPTNDYWFTVEFIEPKDGTLRVFKAHFTLKR